MYYLVEDVMRNWIRVSEEGILGKWVYQLQYDVNEIQEIIHQFDDVINSHAGQYDVVRRGHRRLTENDERHTVSGQSDYAYDWVDEKTCYIAGHFVEVIVWLAVACDIHYELVGFGHRLTAA